MQSIGTTLSQITILVFYFLQILLIFTFLHLILLTFSNTVFLLYLKHIITILLTGYACMGELGNPGRPVQCSVTFIDWKEFVGLIEESSATCCYYGIQAICFISLINLSFVLSYIPVGTVILYIPAVVRTFNFPIIKDTF